MIFERIVFVIRMSAIGDIIIASRAIQTLHLNGYYPVLVTSPQMKELAAMICNLNSFICLDKKGNYETNNADFRLIQTNKPPLILDLQKTSKSKSACVNLIKNENLKFEKKYKVKKRTLFRVWLMVFSWFSYKQKKRTKNLTSFKRIHELQEEVIQKIVREDKKEFVSLSVHTRTLTASLTAQKNKYVCLFPSASGFIKSWPKEKFRNLIQIILNKTDYHVYICGSKEDRYLGEYLDFPTSSRVHNVVGKYSLGQSLNLIANSCYVVSNDSFAAHAADAFLVPASVIFGSTSPKFGFVPIYDRISLEYENLSCSPCTRHGKSNCRFKNLKCMNDMSEQKIYENMAIIGENKYEYRRNSE